MDGMTFEKSALRECFPEGQQRIRGTWYYRINVTGEILEFDVMVVRTEDWQNRKEFGDPTWSAMEFKGLTIAVKAQS